MQVLVNSAVYATSRISAKEVTHQSAQTLVPMEVHAFLLALGNRHNPVIVP